MLEISYGDGVVGSSKFHYRLDDRKKIIKEKYEFHDFKLQKISK